MAITQNGALKRDDNDQPVMGGTSSSDNVTIINSAFDPVTRRLLTDSAGGGTGTVTTVSVVSANGLAGTVTNPTTTPAITLSTTITGILKGDGTAISAASSSTDYAANAFKTIAVSGQSDVVADSPIDTLTLVAGTNMTITTNAGTDTITFASSGGGASGLTIGTTTITSGTTTRILYDNAGVLGEYTINGTGTAVAMATSPSFTTPTLGVATATTINGNTFTTGTYTLTGAAAKTLTFNNTLTLAGTDGTTMTFPSTSATIARTDAANTFTGTQTIGALVATTINGNTFTTGTGVLTIAASKTLTVSNTLTFTGTDTASVAFGGGGTVLYAASTIPLTVGSTTIASGTSTRILYDNAGTLGEYTITGSGTVVAMATAPTFVTSITTPSVLATANDSGALGASGTAFADLFLASGAVINFAASNYTITHSSGLLTTNGNLSLTTSGVLTTGTIELGAATDTTLARVSAGVVSIEGVTIDTISAANTLTNKTLTSPIIQTAPVFAAGTSIKFTVPSSDPSATGITTNEFNSGYSSTAIGDLVYLDSSATWQKADADASSATYSSMLGIALEVKASGAAVSVLLQGFIYAGTPFPTFTIGAPVYMSATAGAVTQTAPVTTDSATRILGYAVHADKMYFHPSNDWLTHV